MSGYFSASFTYSGLIILHGLQASSTKQNRIATGVMEVYVQGGCGADNINEWQNASPFEYRSRYLVAGAQVSTQPIRAAECAILHGTAPSTRRMLVRVRVLQHYY